MGGVGKTQLAAEFVHSYIDRCHLVWWIPAEEPTLVSVRLAEKLGYLPLALDQAVTWHTDTGMPVSEYLGVEETVHIGY